MSADAPNVPWVRLNAGTNQDARLIRAGFWATAAWPAIIMMAKLHGWRGGVIPKADFDPHLLAHHMNAGVTGRTVTRGLTDGIAQLVKVGLLEESATHYVIRSWAKYQSDPTNAERQARYREKTTQGDRVTEEPLRNGSNGDVTGRDVTGLEKTPPTPAPGGSPSAPSSNGPPAGTPERAEPPPASRPPDERPLTTAEREGALAACGAILGERDVAPDVRQRARNVDKLVRSGIVPAEAVREFVRSTVMPRVGARVAYIAAMQGVAS